MSFRVVVLSTAQRDFHHCYNYIAHRSSQGVANWLSRFEEILSQLETDPSACPLAPEDPFVPEKIRQVVFKTKRGLPYRVLFAIVDDEVRILRLRGPGQDLLSDEDFS